MLLLASSGGNPRHCTKKQWTLERKPQSTKPEPLGWNPEAQRDVHFQTFGTVLAQTLWAMSDPLACAARWRGCWQLRSRARIPCARRPTSEGSGAAQAARARASAPASLSRPAARHAGPSPRVSCQPRSCCRPPGARAGKHLLATLGARPLPWRAPARSARQWSCGPPTTLWCYGRARGTAPSRRRAQGPCAQ